MNKKQGSRVQVVVRLRPVLDDKDKEKDPCVQGIDEKSLEIFNWRNNQETLRYSFDAFHTEESSQEDVYTQSVEPLLKHTLEGQNASVFAYGPTGAGKTYTMLGTATDPGIIPRSVRKILSSIHTEQSSCTTWKFTVQFSYLEIYQEKVYDLLAPKNHDLPIREDREKNIFIPGLAEKEVTSFEQFQKYFIPASQNRTTASTKLNSRSSRSHSILLLKIVRTQQISPFRKLTGKLLLIDLAGSEDNRRTGNQGIRLKESGAINVSLFSLGQVVDALNQGLPRIPYRDSKLTRLLQDSLGGSAHACMITNIASEEKFYTDTYTTLNFAAKSKLIINKPFTRESTDKPKSALKRKSSDDDSFELNVTPPKILSEDGCLKENACTPFVTFRHRSVQDLQSETHRPFLSPLLKKQANFEETVVTRLENLEQRILNHFKPNDPPSAPTQSEQQELLKEVEKSRLEILELKKANQQLKEEKSSLSFCNEEPITSECLFQRVPLVKKKSSTRLNNRCIDTLKSDLPLKDKKPANMSPDVQFLKVVPSDIQGKENTTDRTGEKQKGWTVKLNPEFQMTHNTEILRILNTGTVKQLKSLQSIGEKRANLIHNWRESHGHFTSIEQLQKVNGLSKKTVESIVKNNLLSKLLFQ
ncbi:kinesin-like protein KIF22 [Glandiceps talaboti]